MANFMHDLAIVRFLAILEGRSAALGPHLDLQNLGRVHQVGFNRPTKFRPATRSLQILVVAAKLGLQLLKLEPREPVVRVKFQHHIGGATTWGRGCVQTYKSLGGCISNLLPAPQSFGAWFPLVREIWLPKNSKQKRP